MSSLPPAALMLLPMVALAASDDAAEARVRGAIERRLGPQPNLEIRVNEHGRVQLPLAQRYDGARMAEEVGREGLDTPERREKAEVGRGPGDLWTHFLGADEPETDCWADPDFLVSLATLAGAWQDHCTAILGQTPAHCALMVGDISYPYDARPDPLGHRDHHAGDCVDLRLWRTDGSRYEAFWNLEDDRPGRGHAYDALTTRAFVAFAAAWPETRTLLFNDPDAAGATEARGHDDHVHLCIGEP